MTTGTRQQRHRRFWRTQEPAARRPKRRRRHWKLLAAVVAVGLLLLVWFLPTIVAHTPLTSWLLAKATADLQGTVRVESISLGWFSAPAARGIEVHDPQDRPVLQAAEVTSEKSLLALLWNHAALGRLRIEQPKLSVVLRPNGSNIEDLLAKYLAAPKEPPVDVALSVEVVDGSISVTDAASGQTWQIDKLQAAFEMPSGRHGPLHVKASSAIADRQQPGRLDADLRLSLADASEESDAAGPAGEISVDAVQIPLPMLESLVGRFAPQTRLAGRISSKVRGQWGGAAAAGQTFLQGDLSTEGLTFSTPLLGADRVRLDRLELSCQAAQQGEQIAVERCTFDSDIGSAELSGTLALNGKGQRSWLNTALHQTCDLRAELDLARLAQLLPATLRIRPQTQITAGQAEVVLTSRRTADGMAWQGRAETSQLAAVNEGRQVKWERPILITMAAHESPAGPVVEKLTCESDFLKVDAAGTPDNLTATAQFDLRQLAEQLGQFVDLTGLEMAGGGGGRLTWRQSPQKQFDAGGEIQLRNFQIKTSGGTAWSEASLTASAAAKGQTDLAVLMTKGWDQLLAATRVDEAGCRVDAGGDTLQVQLSQPLANLGERTWPLAVWASGRLEGLATRLGTWLPMRDCRIAGGYQLDGQAVISPQQIELRDVRLAAANLHIATPTVSIDEPQAELLASGAYQHDLGLLRLDRVKLTSATLGGEAAGRVNCAAVAGAAESDRQIAQDAELSGQISYDLGRIVALLRPHLGPGVRVVGRGSSPARYRGPLSLAAGQGAASVRWDAADIYGFPLGPGELKATLADGLVNVEPLDLDVSGGRLHLAPRVRVASGPCEVMLPSGPLAQQVHITPQMCASGLKYIAPILAEVTSAQGAFSIELEGCRIPLSDPARGEVAGRLVIHTVEVGPGPLIREFAALLGRETPAKLRRESVVPFRMVDGRVYHKDLELIFPDVTIRTQGSVGLDQSLALIAEMPIPPKWLGNNVVGTALRDQVIRVPIAGTLSRPQLDRSVLDRMNRQLLRNAAENVIEDELGKQLERLLPPPR